MRFFYDDLDRQSLRCMQLKFENLKFLLHSDHSFGTASEHNGLKTQNLVSQSK
jgi:hypothetical protein